MTEQLLAAEVPSVNPVPARPLPVGVFGLPFGYLLLPDGPGVGEVHAGLLRGRLPSAWPARLEGHRLALAGEFDAASAAFAGADPVSRYNRYVLEPDGVDVADLRSALESAAGLGLLVDLVEYTLGRCDTPPAVPQVDGAAGDLRALVLAAHAADRAETDPEQAAQLLEQALADVPTGHPVLAGVLHGALAQLQQATGRPDHALASLTAGVTALTGTDLGVALAEQHLALAALHHERAAARPELLNRAVHHYHCALQSFDEVDAPELFGTLHANLATAYLTMPMVEAGDNLRLGVAIGSLRAALRVFTRERHPRQWASAQLNLANALVYAPSTHQGDNLVEAVELYEAVLQTRDRDSDPLGLARVLANQGNALAHLGMFEHARGKLVEARYLFEEFEQHDAAASVRGLLDEIARQETR